MPYPLSDNERSQECTRLEFASNWTMNESENIVEGEEQHAT